MQTRVSRKVVRCSRKELGKLGEDIAAKYLIKAGYRIIERNFTCFLGELDIVAREGDVLSFIEVKSRTSLKFGLPSESIRTRKKRKIIQLAQVYLKKHKLANTVCRFDIVSVEIKTMGRVTKADVRLIKSAFDN